MKKLSALLLAVIMVLSLAACGGNSAPAATEAPAAATEAPAADAPAAAASSVDFTGKLTAPLAVTSCGQSPGATMLNVVATQAKLTSVCDNGMTAETLPAGTKTLIITMGTSGKGMGAVGTDVDMELARCTELANAAHAAGIQVVGAHVEGMGRRTDANDQKSIDGVLAVSDAVLVIAESDSDNFFTDYCNAHNLPLLKVEKALDAGSVME